MSTGRVTPPTGMRAHHWWMPLVFVTALVVAFFAFAPAALACDHSVVIHKVETGALAPGGAYTVLMTGPDFSRQVTVDAGGSATIAGVPPGLYEFDEVDAPEGATIEPNPLLLTAESSTGTTVDVYVTNPYPAGKLAIQKIETGTAAPGGTYTFDITGSDITGPVPSPPPSPPAPPGPPTGSPSAPTPSPNATPPPAPPSPPPPPSSTTTAKPSPSPPPTPTATSTASSPSRRSRPGHPAPRTRSASPDPVTFTVAVTAGTTWTSDWLPLGTYTVTEVDAPAGATIVPTDCRHRRRR